MSINHYAKGTIEYKQKQKIMEAQTQGFTKVETIKEAVDEITPAHL